MRNFPRCKALCMNLKIRAYLQTPVLSDIYLPLDGILYYHAVRKYKGIQEFTKPGESTNLDYILPIEKTEINGIWFYRCSFAKWSKDMQEGISFKVKSGDWIRHETFLCKKTKTINIKSGKYKNANIELYYRIASYIDWFCIGDILNIKELLYFCKNIGKNYSDGWGSILKWEITEIEDDFSIKIGSNITRSIPNEEGNDYYGIRPSYWDRRNIIKCDLPP